MYSVSSLKVVWGESICLESVHLKNKLFYLLVQATREGAASSFSIVSEPSANIFWQSPVLAERHDNPNLSVLERSLTKHLSDLSNIAR